MSIDWSKAPEEAEFARIWAEENGPSGVDFYKTDGNGRLLYLNVSSWAVAATEPDDPYLIRRPVPWSGEGLPPVGSVQQVETDHRQVTVLAHGVSLGEQVAICQDGNRILMALSKAFRTPDQISAEERRLAIQAITKVLQQERCAGDDDGSLSAEAIYEAGYRKVEGGAA